MTKREGKTPPFWYSIKMVLPVLTRKGFTLIELIVVVAIISILAALAIPAYSDFVSKAKLSEVLVALDRLASAVSEYHALKGNGAFPSDLSVVASGWSNRFGLIEVINANVTEGTYGIKSLKNLPSPAANHYLYIRVRYNPNSGYSRQCLTNLAPKFRPRQ